MSNKLLLIPASGQPLRSISHRENQRDRLNSLFQGGSQGLNHILNFPSPQTNGSLETVQLEKRAAARDGYRARASTAINKYINNTLGEKFHSFIRFSGRP